ncbi:MAG: hypothetical protein K0R63_424 [Rickettsiales bacterium]|jgi:AAA family ATP:ADP antiporter|nr:hypothetical protein [Rickettsiales bacterium]
MLEFLISLCRFNFGIFEKEEFKKFLLMGVIFALIIGVYSALKPLKDAIFIQLVDTLDLPYAKSVSVLALFPAVMLYTTLLRHFSREKMLIILPAFYGVAVLCFSVLMLFVQAPREAIEARSGFGLWGSILLGYVWYVFVESFGSLVVALFWAFAIDTTEPESAKKGFPLIVAVGHIGGIIFPYGIGGIPYRFGLQTDAVSMAVFGLLILCIIPLSRYFLKSTPTALLVSFHGHNQKSDTPSSYREKPGLLDGLKLVFSHHYLTALFAITFMYEVIITIFDFNFKLAAGVRYSSVALSNYLSLYESSVNVVSLLCLLMGVSNIARFFSIGAALAVMPVTTGLALMGFLTLNSLSFLFVLMVGLKAMNFALSGPTLKQLYIPTTTDSRFKAQAWIETFGSRLSKQVGSLCNMLVKPLQTTFGEITGRAYYLLLTGCVCFPLLILWFILAFYLGRNYHRAIQEKRMIC